MRASRITINLIMNDYTKGKNNINVSLTETTRGKELNLPDGPNNGGVNWAKPPYSGTGLTQGMGIDMYILDEKPIYFEDGDLIRIYDKDGNLKCTLEFRKSKSDDSGRFLLTEESSEIYLKSILTTK